MIQYVVVRSDLLHTLSWPVGAVITQACHACSAVIHMFHDDPATQAYLADLDNMHKVVLQVGCCGLTFTMWGGGPGSKRRQPERRHVKTATIENGDKSSKNGRRSLIIIILIIIILTSPF